MNPFTSLSPAQLRDRDVFGDLPSDHAPVVAPCKTIPITPGVRAHEEARRSAMTHKPAIASAPAPQRFGDVPGEEIEVSDEKHELNGVWHSLTLDDKRFVLADALRRSR